MKLRCTSNSIRLRVRKSDLNVLKQTGKVSDSIRFTAETVLSFSLESSTAKTIEAIYTHQLISIKLPQQQLSNWIESTEVGIETHIETSPGNTLHILIEKDFPCLDREEENKEDTFWELVQDKPETC